MKRNENMQSFEKIHRCVFSYSAKLNVTDRQTGQTGGGGVLQYLPSRAFGAAGDNKTKQTCSFIVFHKI